MKVLIACEFSGTVRDAFASQGHNAWSCDLLPTDRPGQHIVGDVGSVLGDGWDLMVAHPPCTYLCSSGMHWTVRGLRDPQLTEDAVAFVRLLLSAPIPRIAVENPVGVLSTRLRKPDQIIQPWFFGEDASKKTCLWLKGLPKLVATNILPGDAKTRRANQTPSGQNRLGPSATRWAERSKTYEGVARAMATQWGGDVDPQGLPTFRFDAEAEAARPAVEILAGLAAPVTMEQVASLAGFGRVTR